MKEKYRLEVQTRLDDQNADDLFYTYYYYRYPSLESAVKSAQSVISQYNARVLGVSVYQGKKFIQAVSD